MSTDREVTRIVRSWLQKDEHESAETLLGTVLDRLDTTPQRRPLWRAWRPTLMNSTLKFAAAGAVVLVAAVAGLALYFSRPAVVPAGSPTPFESPSSTVPTTAPAPSATPTTTPRSTAFPDERTGLVAYTVTEQLERGELTCPITGSATRCTVNRIWVANSDGSDAHELLPDVPGEQNVLGWSRDGSRLLYLDDAANLAFTDSDGSEPELLSEGELCPVDVTDDNCQANVHDAASLSPVASRLAYSISEGRELDISTIVIFDFATRQVARLESTRTSGRIPCRTRASEGFNEFPSWSPDGKRLTFARQAIGPLKDGSCQSAVFTVNPDGSDLRQLPPMELKPLYPRWSPDGSLIAMHVTDFTSLAPDSAGEAKADIYVVRPDGGGLHRLTSDGASAWPHWTHDGRLVFIRWDTPDHSRSDVWIMDASGAKATLLDATSIPALTAAGCAVCPYRMGDDQHEAFWQPTP
jgi:Tol biopolymer transport system component